MSQQFYTYIYIDPKHCIPIYVGKGKGNRVWSHFKAKSHLGNLLRKRQAEGFSTMPMIFTQESEETALAMEQTLIDWYGRADLSKGTLFNLTDGGEGNSGAVRTDDFKTNLSRVNKNKQFSQETRRKLSEAAKNRKHTQETKDKLSELYKGKSRSLEHCRNISQGQTGRELSIETKEKIGNANKGKKRSEEAKLKMSLAATNRKKKNV